MNCENEVLLLPADNCSISTQVDNFLHMSEEVIVFVSEDPLEMDRTVGIKLFKPDGLRLGYFYPILWSLSVFAVVLISHWSEFHNYKR
ncbi:hypothetical protein TNCV_1948341 [Trichonephila clavipes]|nr:hypothetical protein TNCV_1948341 [Trichonephila clavipes]